MPMPIPWRTTPLARSSWLPCTGKLGSDIRNSHTLGIPFLYVATPVPGGAVRMAYPLTVLQQADRQVRNALIKSSAVAVLIAMVFAFFATQSLGKRLRRITEFAERVAAGDLSARIQEDSSPTKSRTSQPPSTRRRASWKTVSGRWRTAARRWRRC